MENVQKNYLEKISSKPIYSNRSKGERLGWTSFSEFKPSPLKDVVGKGEKVDRSRYSVANPNCKLMIP